MNANLSIKNNNWLQQAAEQLSKAGIATAQLDSLVLLEDALNVNRAHILAHPNSQIPARKITQLNTKLQRRIGHEPLAFIREKTEFYGREFAINNYVLEPRPESETMVDQLIQLTIDSAQPPLIVDVGTGSGALAVTAKLQIPSAKVWAIDIDTKCLDIAIKNAALRKADVTFFAGNLLEPIIGEQIPEITILLCNLPYVPDSYQINQAATHEPRLAIFGGNDGLDVYRKLFEQITQSAFKPIYIFTESLPPQHKNLALLASKHGYSLRLSDDFIQLFERQQDYSLA